MRNIKNNHSFILFGLLVVIFVIFQLNTALAQYFLLILPTDFLSLTQQPWRLITGHWVHYSWPHLIINTITLGAALWVFSEKLDIKNCVVFLFFSALIISVGLWLFSNIDVYFGFSGIIYGLISWQILVHLKHAPKLYVIAFILLVAKVIHDKWSGGNPTIEALIRLPIAQDAHWLGVISGVLFWSVCYFRKKIKSSQQC